MANLEEEEEPIRNQIINELGETKFKRVVQGAKEIINSQITVDEGMEDESNSSNKRGAEALGQGKGNSPLIRKPIMTIRGEKSPGSVARAAVEVEANRRDEVIKSCRKVQSQIEIAVKCSGYHSFEAPRYNAGSFRV